LSNRAQFKQEPDRTRFQRLTHLAETIRFGRATVAAEGLAEEAQPVLSEARAMYEEMQRAPSLHSVGKQTS
jgi:hypothetical protein